MTFTHRMVSHAFACCCALSIGVVACSGGNQRVAGPTGVLPQTEQKTTHRFTTADTTSSATPIPTPSGVISTRGSIAGLRTGGLTLDQGYPHGKIPVYGNAGTKNFGASAATGLYALVTGTGSVSSGINPASVISVFPSSPPSVSTSGTVMNGTSYGFTLNVDNNHLAVPIVITPSVTTISGGALVAGELAQVSGLGSIDVSITASQIVLTDPTPTPTPDASQTASPTPAPTATPTPTAMPTATATPAPTPTPFTTYPGYIHLSAGAVIGQYGMFQPKRGDAWPGTSAGTAGQPVDGITCDASMYDNEFHIHTFVGILYNGVQYALPDSIGMNGFGPLINGFVNAGKCFYSLHTHDASGMVHNEANSTMPDTGTLFTLGNLFDIWDHQLSGNGLTNGNAPLTGITRVFVAAQPPINSTYVAGYVENTDPSTWYSIPFYSHTAVWIEIGPPYVEAANLPSIRYYTEY